MPEGIVTTETQANTTVDKDDLRTVPEGEDFVNSIMSLDPKALPKIPKGSERFLFDQQFNNNMPRNVYIETVPTQSGKMKKFLWWHCENGTYVGRKEVIRINPKTEERYLRGHDFNIEATVANIAKLVKLATARTKFYKKYLQETNGVHDVKDFHA